MANDNTQFFIKELAFEQALPIFFTPVMDGMEES